jgi:ribonuclease HII
LKALPERNLWRRFKLLAGVDEAGRGPIAGPVVAAAVILPKDFFDPEIDDSKKLSPGKRERLYPIITKNAVSFAFGIIDHDTIDKINILKATKLAMLQAIMDLNPKPEIVLIDALRIEHLPFNQIPIKKGDTLSISIAAASILAKVRRDTIMCEYHKKYPQYQFFKHKGYPTKLHRLCVKEYGPCPIHRKTFHLLPRI